MPPQAQLELGSLLAYPDDQAGGVMTIVLASVRPSETVEQARGELSRQGGYRAGVGSVAVLDESGQVAGDLPVFDLLLSDGARRVSDLIGPGDPPVTVHPDAPLGTVTAKLMETRRSSLLVVDGAGHPLGRIRPEDVLDALAPGNWRPRFLQVPR
jgi:magnesium transporter